MSAKVTAVHEAKRKHQMKELSNNCSLYEPCPVNFRCIVKASHLYKRCEYCAVPPAQHNHKARAWAIRRENFAIKVTPETEQQFLALSKKMEEKTNE